MIPFVIEKTHDGERSYDIYSRLLKDRVIFIGSEINNELANSVIAQLLLLNRQDSRKDIDIFINSPGGVVTAGLAIIDTINFITADVRTVCVGSAASMAAILLSAGTKGKRLCLPNSRIMVHEPRMSGGPGGTTTEIEIEYNEIAKLREMNAKILSENSNLEVEDILKKGAHDHWMGAEDAVDLGIVDQIVKNESQTTE